VARLAPLRPARVLELAAGTGVVTRELSAPLPSDVQLVATDLNEAMLAVARAQGTAREVTWRQADAMALPFEDASFDAVVCQFGAMFFPDKAQAFAEARRVLRPGGTLLFNVWDRIETNDFAHVVSDVLAELFPADPPRFMASVPHGYFSADAIARDVALAGFARPPIIATVTATSRADTPRHAALAYCQGTPMRGEIEARGGVSLEDVTAVAAAALAARFGEGAIAGRIQALVVQVAR
jgi:SAM-dependent methyltransferase